MSESLKLNARLDIDTSAEKIVNEDLPKLQKAIASNPNGKLKIECVIDTSNIKQLQSQLSSVAKNVKIEAPQITVDSIVPDTEITNNIVERFNRIFGLVGKMGKQVKDDFNSDTQTILQEFANAAKSAMSGGSFAEYESALDKIISRIAEFSKGDLKRLKEQIDELRSSLSADGSYAYINEATRQELKNLIEESDLRAKALDNVYGRNNHSYSHGVGIDAMADENHVDINNLAEEIIKTSDAIERLKSESGYITELENSLESIGVTGEETDKKVRSTILNTLHELLNIPKPSNDSGYIELMSMDDFDFEDYDKATDKMNNFTAAVNNFKATMDDGIVKSIPNTGSFEVTSELAKQLTGGTRISNATSDAENQLVRFNVQVEDAEKRTEQLRYKLNETGDAFEYVGKTIREATNATELRKRPIEVSYEINSEKLKQFEQELKQSTIPNIEEIKAQFENVRKAFNEIKVGDTFDAGKLHTYLDEFEKLSAKYKTAKISAEGFEKTAQKLQKTLSSEIKQLDSQLNSTVFRKNISDTDVQNQIAEIDALRQKLSLLMADLNKADTPEALVAIDTELKALTPDFESVIKSSKDLQANLRNNNALESRENKLAKLRATLDEFANANKRAVNSTKQMSDGKTFADAWKEINEAMKTANLDEAALQHLNEQLATFKSEAKAAGLTSSGFFREMGSQIKQITAQYVSLYAVMSKMREAVQNVIDIDTAMVDLRKVTEETDAKYEQFLTDSNKQARDLHSTMTDVIEQTAEWAKLGYGLDEAAELSNVSMIYSKVGEVDNDTAVGDLVTSMKAFNMEAEDSIQIVDRFNKLGKQYCPNT